LGVEPAQALITVIAHIFATFFVAQDAPIHTTTAAKYIAAQEKAARYKQGTSQ